MSGDGQGQSRTHQYFVHVSELAAEWPKPGPAHEHHDEQPA